MLHVHGKLARIGHAEPAAEHHHFIRVRLITDARQVRHRRGLAPGAHFSQQGIETRRGQLLVIVVVQLHGRGAGARSDAFHFFQGEDSVRSGFFVPDAQSFFRVFPQFFSTAGHAGDAGANLHVALARRLAPQHRVVGQSFRHLQGVQVQPPGDFRDHFVAHAAEFVLRVHEHGDERGALYGIAPQELLKLPLEFFRQGHQRSISPSTISSVPMQATTSATSRPSQSRGSAWRFTNEGVRNFTRKGLGEPSLTT